MTGFYEDDEPVAHIADAFGTGPHPRTAPPGPCPLCLGNGYQVKRFYKDFGDGTSMDGLLQTSCPNGCPTPALSG